MDNSVFSAVMNGLLKHCKDKIHNPLSKSPDLTPEAVNVIAKWITPNFDRDRGVPACAVVMPYAYQMLNHAQSRFMAPMFSFDKGSNSAAWLYSEFVCNVDCVANQIIGKSTQHWPIRRVLFAKALSKLAGYLPLSFDIRRSDYNVTGLNTGEVISVALDVYNGKRFKDYFVNNSTLLTSVWSLLTGQWSKPNISITYARKGDETKEVLPAALVLSANSILQEIPKYFREWGCGMDREDKIFPDHARRQHFNLANSIEAHYEYLCAERVKWQAMCYSEPQHKDLLVWWESQLYHHVTSRYSTDQFYDIPRYSSGIKNMSDKAQTALVRKMDRNFMPSNINTLSLNSAYVSAPTT